MSLKLKKLARVLQENFDEPFLVSGGVTVEYDEDRNELSICIGRRDLTIDSDGNVVAAGTFLGMPADVLTYEENDNV